MEIEIIRNKLLSFDLCTEETPWGEDTLVYKFMGKVFAILGIDDIPARLNLKCDPNRSSELREEYPSISGAFHMNKVHWNSLILDDSIPHNLIFELSDHSYDLIKSKIPKKKIQELLGNIK
jgi:predicted DNA-binding protein (MmcQ/YjbR family)